MAQNQLGISVDASFISAIKGLNNTSGLTAPVDYTTISALRNVLSTYDNVTYTSSMLDTMSVNDMIFAVRNIKDPKTIADYMNVQGTRA
ncbi:hypothetical protein [Streptomyces hebeiensis]